jgi:hypothetical protein
VSDPGRIEAVILHRSTFLRNLGIAVAATGCATSFLVRGDVRLPWLIGFGTTGLALALVGRDGAATRVHASLDAEGIFVGNRLVASRRTIRSAWIEQTYQGKRVHIDRGPASEIELEAADDADARELLQALGCDPSQAVVKFPSPSRLAALAGAIGGQLCAYLLVGRAVVFTGSLMALSVVTCLTWYLLFFLFGRHLTSVGSDGVLMSGPLRSRFVPFADIESAAVVAPGKLVLRTRAGAEIIRWMTGPAADAAAELIQSAIGADPGGSENLRRQLRREGENDIGAWLARLRALASHEPYRAAVLAGDSLWRVVDDPNASGVERAAAAVVLGAAATDDERARLRRAAARMASPPVRVAILRVADPVNDEELAVAMEAVAARDSAA